MISLTEACEIVLQRYEHSNSPYITDIVDIGYGYAIICSWNPDEFSTYDGVAVVDKISGEVKYYCYPQVVDEIMNGKDVPIPEKYTFKKK